MTSFNSCTPLCTELFPPKLLRQVSSTEKEKEKIVARKKIVLWLAVAGCCHWPGKLPAGCCHWPGKLPVKND